MGMIEANNENEKEVVSDITTNTNITNTDDENINRVKGLSSVNIAICCINSLAIFIAFIYTMMVSVSNHTFLWQNWIAIGIAIIGEIWRVKLTQAIVNIHDKVMKYL